MILIFGKIHSSDLNIFQSLLLFPYQIPNFRCADKSLSKGVGKHCKSSINARRCSDLLISVHLHLMGFLSLALKSHLLSQPFQPLWPHHMPLTGEKPRLAACDQSPHMLRGGTPEGSWQYSFSQQSLQGKERCFLCLLLCYRLYSNSS